MPRSIAFAAVFAVLALGRTSVDAGPQDTYVGEVRVIYDKAGVVIRTDGNATAAPVATLPVNTQVRVLEVKLPWVKVEASPGPGQAAVQGWLRAYQAIEPQALAVTPPPAHVDPSKAARVDQRQVSAAGRQFTASTERDYRGQNPNLAAAYASVDAMEQATAAMDPGASIAFIMDGSIGRRGCDYVLPARLPPSPDPAPAKRKFNPLEEGGGLLKKLGEKVGVKEKHLEGLIKFASPLIEARAEQLKQAFTPDQQYYLGRAVAAQAIAKHGVEPDQRLRAYVRNVWDAVIRTSFRVQPNYGGYHVEVLASDEVNGVSGPGGFVLITRGAVKACRTEDELAGVLCHELAHITRNHAEQIMRQGTRWNGAMKGFLGGVAAVTGVDDKAWGAQLVHLFSEAVGEMTRVSMDHSYGSALELDADLEGSYQLQDVWYDWWALRNVLASLGEEGHAHGGATHASPRQRVQLLDPKLQALGAYPAKEGVTAERLARFHAALGRAAPPR
jgi:beta-barrel assembly-enhancing protease